jgi:hypothetical protein
MQCDDVPFVVVGVLIGDKLSMSLGYVSDKAAGARASHA